MMSKYKIKEYGRAFKVWELRNIGGWVWDDVEKTVFKTREEAEEYIRRRKEGEEK